MILNAEIFKKYLRFYSQFHRYKFIEVQDERRSVTENKSDQNTVRNYSQISYQWNRTSEQHVVKWYDSLELHQETSSVPGRVQYGDLMTGQYILCYQQPGSLHICTTSNKR